MAKENKTKYAILGLLAKNSMTGYDIKKIIEQKLNHFWKISYGQIYPNLNQLEKDGLIKSEISEDKFKKTYTINEKGMKEFLRWIKEPTEEEKLRYEMLLKIHFGEFTEKEVIIENIKKFGEEKEALFLELSGFENLLRDNLKNCKFDLITLLCGKHIYKAFSDWAKEAVEILENEGN